MQKYILLRKIAAVVLQKLNLVGGFNNPKVKKCNFKM
jgi:hypothetical protein